ncbi:hypothetical protein BDF19DRAFT_434053, partial [Syncephalis fuscata]
SNMHTMNESSHSRSSSIASNLDSSTMPPATTQIDINNTVSSSVLATDALADSIQPTPSVPLSINTQPSSTTITTMPSHITADHHPPSLSPPSSSSVLSSLLRHGQYSIPSDVYSDTITTETIPSALDPSAWESDREATVCRNCQRRFTLWIRRHHCRRCGLVFCNQCSMGRAIMMISLGSHNGADIEDGFQLGPLLLERFPSLQRVCNNCQQWLSSPTTGATAAAATTPATAIGATASMRPTNTPLSSIPLASSSSSIISRNSNLHRRNSLSSVQSTMMDCPVCGVRLDSLGEREQQERHLRDCFDQPDGTPRGLTTVSYAVHILAANSPLLNKECPICFEEFDLGHQVAHLNCLCIYHRQCIDGWLVRGHLCPVHGQ